MKRNGEITAGVTSGKGGSGTIIPLSLRSSRGAVGNLVITIERLTAPTAMYGVDLTAEEAARLRKLDLPDGRYRIAFEASGFKRVSVDAEMPRKLGIDVKLEALEQVSGIVVDRATRAPLAGVAIRTVAGETIGFTDKRGEFSVPRESFGRIARLDAPGYGARFVSAPPGASVRLAPIEMSQSAALQITLGPRLRSKSPVRIELVEKDEDSGFHVVRDQTVVEDSFIAWDGIEPGRYAVRLSGAEPLQKSVLPITLEALQTLDLPAEIDPASLVVRTTRNEQPAPATIKARSSDVSAELETHESGEATYEAWSRGEFLVRVRTAEMATDYATVRRIETKDVTWDLEIPIGELTVVVTDAADQKPIAGASVVLGSSGEEVGSRVRQIANEAGTVRFSGLDQGSYSLNAEARGYQRLQGPAITIAPGNEKQSLSVQLTKASDSTLTIADAVGVAVPSAVVLAVAEPARVLQRVITNSSGVAVISVDPRITAIIAIAPDGTFAVSSLAGVPLPRQHRIVIAPASSSVHLATTLGGRASAGISFVVRYAGVTLPSDVIARIERAQGRPIATDAGGLAVLERIPEGPYELWPVLGPANVTAGAGAQAAPIRLNARAGLNAVNVALEIEKP